MGRPLRLTVDMGALQSNWRWLADRSGVACGGAIKADGYGLGAKETLTCLHQAGCRDFFVTTWDEVDRLGAIPEDASVAVLHGVRGADMATAIHSVAKPVL